MVDTHNTTAASNHEQDPLGEQLRTPPRRLHARWPVGMHVNILPVSNLRTAVPQTLAPIQASCRDLSIAGMGVQTSRSLKVGDPVITLLQPRDRTRPNAVSAVVQRCTQNRPGLYDLALLFENPIDIQDYIDRDCFDNKFTHENVPPEMIACTTVLAAGSKLDASIIKLAFQHNPKRLTIAHSRSQFLSIASRQQVAIIAADTPLASAGDIIVDLYANGFAGKAILIADGTSEATRHLVNKLPFAAVIVRPFSKGVVLSALGQALCLTRTHALETLHVPA